MNDQKMSNLKPVISVSQMAKVLNLSRSRFYQLLEQGIFPQPVYDLINRRPIYDQRLQRACFEIRETGIGINNRYVIFYSSRKMSSKKVALKKSKITDVQAEESEERIQSNPLHKEFSQTLNVMGVNCSVKKVSDVLSALYPNGFIGIDSGIVIRELFRHLKSK